MDGNKNKSKDRGAPLPNNPMLQPPPPKITLATQNARGLNDPTSAKRLFNTILNQTQTDILLLQETFLSKEKEDMVTKLWQSLGGGETYFAPSFGNSRGSAIFLKGWIKTNSIIKFIPAKDGRSTLIDINFLDFKMRIINIYAPNTGSDRELYFAKLASWIKANPSPTENVIIGGDFNMVEDFKNDRTSKNVTGAQYDTQQSTKGCQQLRILTVSLSLQDAWRANNTAATIYTWRGPRDRCKSRLDRFTPRATSQKHLKPNFLATDKATMT